MFASHLAPVLLESPETRLVLDLSEQRGLREVALAVLAHAVVQTLVVDVVRHDRHQIQVLRDALQHTHALVVLLLQKGALDCWPVDLAQNAGDGLLGVQFDGLDDPHDGGELESDLAQNLEERDGGSDGVARAPEVELDLEKEEDLLLVEDGKQLLGEDELELDELRALEDVEEGVDVLLGVLETLLADLLDAHSLVELEGVREVGVGEEEEEDLDLRGRLAHCLEGDLEEIFLEVLGHGFEGDEFEEELLLQIETLLGGHADEYFGQVAGVALSLASLILEHEAPETFEGSERHHHIKGVVALYIKFLRFNELNDDVKIIWAR